MKITNKYQIFLASPGDTKEERDIVEKIIKELNETIGNRNDFHLELLKWENNVYPDFGEDGQDVINNQIGDEYDIFIGLMFKRFGTETKRAGSGTKEEFSRAYDRFKKKGNVKIMFYFNNSALPQNTDFEQFNKVQDFKKSLGELGGLYWNYDGVAVFETLLRNQLTNCVLDLNKTQYIENNNQNNGVEKNKNEPIQIKKEFNDFLNDTEIVFAHSIVDEIKLNDIFLPPDLRNLDKKQKNTYSGINLDELTNAIDVEGFKYVFIGNDASGKSSISKYLYTKYFQYGLTPILIKGSELKNKIRKDALVKFINKKLEVQYDGNFTYSSEKSNDFVIIIDDFHKTTKAKNKYWSVLIENLENICPNIILTGNKLMPLETLSGQDPFKNFTSYFIQEFGPKFRYDLVKKWYSLGSDNVLENNELRRKIDFALKHIKTIIGKGFIPSHPFYLLSILQSIESGNTQNQNYSVHGFYYEHLINDSLIKQVKDIKDISLYYNYLTQFCYFIFDLGISEINQEDFNSFHKLYCDKHDLSYNVESLLQTFVNAKLLSRTNNRIQVKEKYIYYFFIAKYISNNIGKTEIKELIKKMSLRIFKDEYASIIMFVTHLSKDNFILGELVKNSKEIFAEIPICKMEEDISSINDLIEYIPRQVLEEINVDNSRKEQVEEEDNNEKIEEEFENEMPSYDDIDLDDDISDIDVYAKITRALKSIDLLGQIVRKYWGELDGKQKLELINTTYELGLRTLGFYINLLQDNKDHIVNYIKELIKEKHIKDKFQLQQGTEELAKNYIFKMCFLSSFGITKRISNAISYDRLIKTYDKALISNPINSVKLIDLSIKLNISNISSHIDLIKEYEGNMGTNKLSFMVLRNLAIDHLYMFETDYKTRTKLKQVLKLSEQEQLKIQATSTINKKKILSTTLYKNNSRNSS